jgi:thiamine-phosphate diphosphorylase
MAGDAVRLPRPAIMMVTDRSRGGSGVDGLVGAVRAAAAAGVDLVQVRERGLDDGPLLMLARRVREAVEGTATRVAINDRLDVALAAAAHGVHLPSNGVSARRIRDTVSADILIGRSVHGEEEAVAAERDGGYDYLVFGTVFATASKPTGHPVRGLDALGRVCRAVALPVLAIGGVTVERVPGIARAGASGIAAIGLFAPGSGEEIAAAVTQVRAAFRA